MAPDLNLIRIGNNDFRDYMTIYLPHGPRSTYLYWVHASNLMVRASTYLMGPPADLPTSWSARLYLPHGPPPKSGQKRYMIYLPWSTAGSNGSEQRLVDRLTFTRPTLSVIYLLHGRLNGSTASNGPPNNSDLPTSWAHRNLGPRSGTTTSDLHGSVICAPTAYNFVDRLSMSDLPGPARLPTFTGPPLQTSWSGYLPHVQFTYYGPPALLHLMGPPPKSGSIANHGP
ncbi:hypothetical protein FNV43_RR13015 [Rhamnella rubrinervis]|uniref:Uncharacterized protein n=1 Tax=Rhamnella rubrinervis TaxID=2594499 RepID=A0A8K0MEQ4_9ROSA|nr:hypothetical protein FNV43_RR13015 [Rhamnella rubrinervis]